MLRLLNRASVGMWYDLWPLSARSLHIHVYTEATFLPLIWVKDKRWHRSDAGKPDTSNIYFTSWKKNEIEKKNDIQMSCNLLLQLLMCVFFFQPAFSSWQLDMHPADLHCLPRPFKCTDNVWCKDVGCSTHLCLSASTLKSTHANICWRRFVRSLSATEDNNYHLLRINKLGPSWHLYVKKSGLSAFIWQIYVHSTNKPQFIWILNIRLILSKMVNVLEKNRNLCSIL